MKKEKEQMEQYYTIGKSKTPFSSDFVLFDEKSKIHLESSDINKIAEYIVNQKKPCVHVKVEKGKMLEIILWHGPYLFTTLYVVELSSEEKQELEETIVQLENQ